jgi:prepilin-type N-terminal cleavage/methylation domain-containing protein
MLTSRCSRQKGFTLIEVVMVIVLLGIIGLITFQVLFSGVETFAKARARKDLYDQARLALERMVREIRDADQIVSPTPGSSGSSINFTKVHTSPADSSTTITFQLNGANLERVGDASGTVVLASNVTAFQATQEAKNLVMVTGDGGFGSGVDDNAKKALFESFGYTVTAIDDQNPQATFNTAAANNDVMYISESVTSGNVGTKARDLDIGIVNEEEALLDEMEFANPAMTGSNGGTLLNIVDNSHYITSTLATGNLTIFTAPQPVYYTSATLATGAVLLANEPTSGNPGLLAFETGAALNGGFTAQNRRVSFHFMHQSNPALWAAGLRTMLERSLDWAAHRLSGNPVLLQLSLSSPNGGTVTMRSRAYPRNVP